jgi:transcription antitermination factor NusA-like protein
MSRSKAAMVAEVVRREVKEAMNEAVAMPYAAGDSDALKRNRDYIVSMVEQRIQRQYVMLEISDVIEWHPRKAKAAE